MKKNYIIFVISFVLIILLCCIHERPVYAEDPVPIDEKHFPDAYFRKYIKEQCGTAIDQVYELHFEDPYTKKIKSLKGIEYFTGLEQFDCSYMELDSLDLSKNVKLEYLSCSGCGLKSLNLSKNKELEELFCENNPLGKLDLSNNPALRRLFCLSCKLTSLDLSNNKKLEHLNCIDNTIKTLKLRDHPSLEWVDCYQNKMTSLDVTGCPKLRRLQCDENQLTSLDLSHNPELVRLHCYFNKLTELDVSNNLKLSYLNCHTNELSSLDVRLNTELETLYCGNPYFKTLDLSKNTKLKYLTCSRAMNLESVKLPASLTHIVKRAFQSCDNLKYIYIDDTVTKIEDYSLGYTESDEAGGSSVSASVSVEGQTKLRKLSLVIGGKKNSAAHRYAKKFGFKFVKDRNYGKPIKKKTMTFRVSGDGTAALTKLSKKKASVVIPKTVQFKGKTYKVTRIGAKVFCRNSKIKKVTIGANVKEIGTKAFYGAKNLKTVIIKTKKLKAKKVGNKAFTYAGRSNYKKFVVKVPKRCKKTYSTLLKKKGLDKKVRIKGI